MQRTHVQIARKYADMYVHEKKFYNRVCAFSISLSPKNTQRLYSIFTLKKTSRTTTQLCVREHIAIAHRTIVGKMMMMKKKQHTHILTRLLYYGEL